MKVYIDDKFIAISGFTKEDKASLKRRFTFEDKSNVFAGGKFDSRKIKKVFLIKFSGEYGLLFSGFLKEFLEFCKSNKLKIESIEDKRTKKKFEVENTRQFFPEEFSYVKHQEEALKKMLKLNVGIIKMPTSAGKTELFIAYLKATKMRALIIMDKVTLVTQTKKRLEEAGLKNVGEVHGKKVEDGDIVVSTIQSIYKNTDFTKFDCLILDESHHSKSDRFQEFLYNTSFPFRFGFSATPEPPDKYHWAKIRQFLGDVVYEVDAEELMDNKILAKPTINFIESKGSPAPDWPSSYEISIVKNNHRNELIKELIDKYNTSTLILVRLLDHGNYLEEDIEGSLFLSGKHSEEERQDAIERFENGELKTLIATSIFNEGISINIIKLLIIASGGKSKRETIQKLGRGLRSDPKTGKFTVDVYDFLDRGNRFTLRHSKERAKIYQKEGFDVNLPQ